MSTVDPMDEPAVVSVPRPRAEARPRAPAASGPASPCPPSSAAPLAEQIASASRSSRRAAACLLGWVVLIGVTLAIGLRYHPGYPAGDWLPPPVRRVLARELLAVLERGEQIEHVLLTSTGDSHDVQLAVTDRRLLWLRDDALTDRVRQIARADVTGVEARRGRRGRTGTLRVHVREGRGADFAELRPEVLGALEHALQHRARMADTPS